MTNLVAQVKRAYNEGGVYYVLTRGAKFVDFKTRPFLAEPYYRLVKRGRFFEFQGETYAYLYRRYNYTFWNERSVELPIVWRIVKNCKGRILEVGNVLSHYFPCRHDVLDKYEKGRGVINCDVVDFKPTNKYDLVVSISTLEHVGFEPPEESNPKKILNALENLHKNCLTEGGRILVTLPLSQNPGMDDLLYDEKLGFTQVFYLKRISSDNLWIETDANGVANTRYGFPFPGANAVVVGVISNATKHHEAYGFLEDSPTTRA